MYSQKSTKMIFFVLTLSCFMLNVQSDDFTKQDTLKSDDSVLIGDSNVSKDVFSQTITKRDTRGVEVERSEEIPFTTTIQKQARNNDKKRTNNAALNAQTTQFSPRKQRLEPTSPDQIVFRQSTEQLEVPNADKYNRLLFSVTNFGISVLKIIDRMVTGNVVVSPYSISSLLSLLQQGATGKTQEELTRALNMLPDASAAAYSRISTDYKNRNTRSILKTATSIFIGEDFNINHNLKRIAQASFDSDIISTSYARPDHAAQQINKWVSKKTNNKIETLIVPETLDQTTQLVLVNAIYFKGLWDVPFRADSTRTREFILSNGDTKRVQFMRMTHVMKAGVDTTTKAKVVILPFERNEYSLMVILPSASERISDLLATLTDDRLVSYLSFPTIDTELELPKFIVRDDTNLEIVLQNMGVTKMFGSDAELHALGSYRGYPPQISSAVHSAVLSIDEQGGSAAAATGFAAVALSYDEPSFSFIANKPFLVVLWDTASALPLFMAKIEDPTQS